MPFSNESIQSKALIKNSYQSKEYSLQTILTEFSKINGETEGLDTSLERFGKQKKTSTKATTATDRNTHSRTEENVTTVGELVRLLNQEGQKQSRR